VFSKVYNLTETKKDKLLEIVKVQLTRILGKIGEAGGSSEEDADESFNKNH
jgi:hypothetical protein